MNDTRKLEQLALIALAVLLAIGCLLILRPFLSAILWALILALATWPGLLWIERRLRIGRGLAALFLTLALVFVCVLPLALISWNLADNVASLYEAARDFTEKGIPSAPEWLKQTPYIGERLATAWNDSVRDRARLLAGAQQFFNPAKDLLLASGAFLGQAVFHSALSLFVLFFLYRDGETLFRRLEVGASKLAGARSRRLLRIAGTTLQSSIYGIVGTAIAQGALAGIGFLIAGVPAPMLLGLATFVLSPVPVGPPLVWGAMSIWLYSNDEVGWAIFLILWGVVVVSSVDNFIKPILISRGSDLPFVLVLLGVMGGALTFGALGVFLGPALLAVGYTVVKEWSEPIGNRSESVAIG